MIDSVSHHLLDRSYRLQVVTSRSAAKVIRNPYHIGSYNRLNWVAATSRYGRRLHSVTFAELSTKAQEDLKGYSRGGELVVSAEATFDPATNQANVRQFGQRMGMGEFAPFFKADSEGKKVAELKEIYIEIKGAVTYLPSQARRMLWSRRSGRMRTLILSGAF